MILSWRCGVVLPFLLSILFLQPGCDLFNSDDPDDATPSTEQEIARVFQTTLSVPSTSSVEFAGPVEPGTVIIEKTPGDAPVQTTVPDSAGKTYVFFIDDEPTMKLEHSYRYVWMDFDSKTYLVIDASWRGKLIRPGVSPTPFELKESFTVDGVSYSYMEGDGEPELQDDSQKELFESPLLSPPDDGWWGKPLRAPVKHAFVFDGGDEGGKKANAKAMYEIDAKPIADWVKANGFTTKHVSQYVDSPNKCFKPTASEPSIRNQFLNAIEDYGKLFTDLGPPDDGCDEFFLYVGSHAIRLGSIVFYYPDGSDNALVNYGTLLYRIGETFPSYVKITIFIDACYSGKAISSNRSKIDELCDKLCAFTLFTSSDSVQTAVMSGTSTESGTQDFLEGANQDHDGDGNIGDIQDRFLEMKQEWGNRGPMSVHCPDSLTWCSLDGTATQTACAGIDGTYQVAVNEVTDPAGHREFVGEPFENLVAISTSSPITVTGQAPFVDVIGSIDEGCSFTATGSGTVAGYSDVSVTMSGTYSVGVLQFTYTMGAAAELPQGESIIFSCTGTKR